MDLHQLLVKTAQKEGFPLAGSVDLDQVLPHSNWKETIQHLDQWLQEGYAGAMEYLARGRDRRADPRLLFPEAQSIFCVALPYPKKPAGAATPEVGPRYARYLQGPDYHLEIAEKLERVMQTVATQHEGLKWKICVDTSAVLERSWAALAGLGWIGKNSLLIHPKLGSYLFLAEVLMNQPTGKAPAPLPNYCGNCTRCLTACPPQAFPQPRVLNSNRCISYWTLEKRGELGLSAADQKSIGPWIAGCDICQEVCPFNQKPSRNDQQEIRPNATQVNTWDELLTESEEAYRLRVKNSAMKRIKPEQFKRNLEIARKNSRF